MPESLTVAVALALVAGFAIGLLVGKHWGERHWYEHFWDARTQVKSLQAIVETLQQTLGELIRKLPPSSFGDLHSQSTGKSSDASEGPHA